jgi:hypothetical protein
VRPANQLTIAGVALCHKTVYAPGVYRNFATEKKCFNLTRSTLQLHVLFTSTYLQTTVLCRKYYSGDPVKENEMGGACGTYGREERCIECFVRRLEGTNWLVKPRNRLEYNIKMDPRIIEWGS